MQFGAPTTVSDERLMSKEGKMEKSFLNFKVSHVYHGRSCISNTVVQAAHPEWQPTDPSGSLYLSRMQDLTTVGLGRRRLLRKSVEIGPGMESTILHDRKADGFDRSPEVDRALRQSQTARRRGSLLTQSRPGVPASPSTMFQSSVGLGLAQTAVLGDSQGSTLSPPPASTMPVIQTSTIPEEDFVEDGGVSSPLGESYADGRPKGPAISQSQQEEDDALEDGGVLGLLAQIYGTGTNLNLKGRGRGARGAI